MKKKKNKKKQNIQWSYDLQKRTQRKWEKESRLIAVSLTPVSRYQEFGLTLRSYDVRRARSDIGNRQAWDEYRIGFLLNLEVKFRPLLHLPSVYPPTAAAWLIVTDTWCRFPWRVLAESNRLQNMCCCFSGFAFRNCGHDLSCGLRRRDLWYNDFSNE